MMDFLNNTVLNEDRFFSRFRALFIVFISLGFVNAFTKDFYKSGKIDFTFLSLSVSLMALIFYVLYVLWEGGKERENFIVFVYENHDRLRQGKTIYWHYRQITKDTKLVVFYSVLSFVLFTDAYPSKFIFRDENIIFRFGVLYTLVCLFCGWWSISLAPIYNIKYIIKNIRGGHKYTVESLLDEIDRDIIAESKKRLKKSSKIFR